MTQPPLRTATAVVAGLSSLIALTACGGTKAGNTADGPIAVEATDDACRVARTTADAGTLTFQVTNKGSKVTEFYLYAEGDRILGEVENVGPGITRRLPVEINQAGRYTTACKPGMSGNGIRGEFTVTGGAAKQADTNSELAQAAKGYQTYVATQADALEQQTSLFVDAVKAGKVDEAKKLYPTARVYFERIEPITEKFNDLDPKVDARPADLDAGTALTGWHRLERDLWQTGPQPDSNTMADQLLSDTRELLVKARALEVTPLDMANGAKSLLDEVATKKVTGEEEAFSHTDLWDFRANVDGSRAAVNSLRPVLNQRDAKLLSAVDERFAAVDALLDKHRVGEGFTLYTDLTQDEIRTLAAAVDALGEPLSKVAGVVAQK